MLRSIRNEAATIPQVLEESRQQSRGEVANTLALQSIATSLCALNGAVNVALSMLFVLEAEKLEKNP